MPPVFRTEHATFEHYFSIQEISVYYCFTLRIPQA